MRFKKSTKAFSLIELSIIILIIGVLIAGTFQADKMLQKFRLTTARALTESSPVSTITGLSMWLDSTSEKSFADFEAVDGAMISNWYDINTQSAVGRNSVSQSSTSRKPLYSSNSINGLPSVKFDGSNDALTTSSTSNLVDYNQTTIFFVEKCTCNSSTDTTLLLWNSGSQQLNIHAPYVGYIYFDFGPGGGSGRLGYAVGTDFYNNPKIVTLLHNADNYSEIRINGTLVASKTTATATLTNASASLVFGNSSNGGTTTPFLGHIGEMIVFNRALTVEERSAVESYLSKKWGI